MTAMTKQPMYEAGSLILADQLDKLHKLEQGVKENQDTEAIHKMRVTTRRIRAALRVYQPFFKRKSVQPWAGALKRLTHALGEVRDLDVQIEKAQMFLHTPNMGESHQLQDFVAELHEQRAAAYKSLRRKLRKSGYKHVLAGLTALSEQPDKHARKVTMGEPWLVCDVIPAALWEHYGQVHCFSTFIHENPSLQILHQLRLTLKRFRYLLEFNAELLGDEGQRMIALTTEAQDTLGQVHDTDVTNQLLADYQAEHKHSAGGSTELSALQQFANQQTHQLAEGLTDFAALWQQLDGAEFRQLLCGAVNQLAESEPLDG